MSTGDDEDDSDRNSIYFSTIRSRHADFFKSSRAPTVPLKNHKKKTPIRYSAHTSTSTGSFPTLHINKLSYSRDLRNTYDRLLLRLPVLKQEFHNVTFQLNSGDCMAIMYTKESEMMSLLEVISGVSSKRKINGDIFVNGHRMPRDRLKKTISYVKNVEQPRSLSIRQYLVIQAQLNPSSSPKYGGVMHLVNRLIADLSLSPVRNLLCHRANRSQWTRTLVAVQLIRDPTILLISDLLRDIDVHDQCFLIDYLRTWATKTNKIVLLAHFPTSLEVLKLFSKTMILASGRVVFFGTPNELPEYFNNIGCPCPKFKNPCDYYVDLVTHDNLTIEASRESSIRISRLVNKWMLIGPRIERGSLGKVLLDLPRGNVIRQISGLFSMFILDVWNNSTSRILGLLFIFTLSTIFSIYLSDLSSILPEAFLNRSMVMEVVEIYFPLIIGILYLRQNRKRIRETGVVLYFLVNIIFVIFESLMFSLSVIIPMIIFIDFHQADYQNHSITLFIITFFNILEAILMTKIFSVSGFVLSIGFLHFMMFRNLEIVQFFNPKFFGHINLLRLLYSESSKNLFSCGRTILNTTQITKGPCQRVDSMELIKFFDYSQASKLNIAFLQSFPLLFMFLLSNSILVLLVLLYICKK